MDMWNIFANEIFVSPLKYMDKDTDFLRLSALIWLNERIITNVAIEWE
jgi:hypothetical protein